MEHLKILYLELGGIYQNVNSKSHFCFPGTFFRERLHILELRFLEKNN